MKRNITILVVLCLLVLFFIGVYYLAMWFLNSMVAQAQAQNEVQASEAEETATNS